MKRIVICLLCALGVSAAMFAGTKEDDARASRELVEAGTDGITDWAIVKIPAASIRTSGRHSAEMSTQAVLGTPVRVIEKGDSWWNVQTPDGYTGWIPSSSVAGKSAAEMKAWRSAPKLVVNSPFQVRVYETPGDDSRVDGVVTDLVNGCIVELKEQTPDGFCKVALPDGRSGYINGKYMTAIADWADQPFDADGIIRMASSMMGTPYLWGGTSTKALDCSGLAKVSYYNNGRILMRDASQQAVTGRRIEAKDWPTCRKGDLLFFGNADTGRVTHVAIYDRDGGYVHSSGRVKYNSVDPKSDLYLSTPFLHAVRIDGYEGTPGITKVIDHPWYFNK